LILLGQLDIPEVVAVAEVLTTKVSNIQKTIIPNVGHLPHMEKPEEFNHVVLDFLRKLHGGASPLQNSA
jgi:pimeloyl-ACP methyl ester carboxylesterase